STTSGSCLTGGSGCQAQTSATAASGQVVADVIAEERISTAVQLAEEAAQAEHAAAVAARVASRADATAEQKKIAAEAAARAQQARLAAAEAAELAVRPVTGAPATTSRADGIAQCAGPGCAARTTGATAGVGWARTAATCATATTGCGVRSDASSAGWREAGFSADGRAGSLAICPDAGCIAALSGHAAAGEATTSRSSADGATVCTGATPCTAMISAGVGGSASPAGARPDERFATSSAAVEAYCVDGSATGCATRASSTTQVTAVGDAGVRGRSTSTCGAPGRCSAQTGGLSGDHSAEVGAGCIGSGCRIRTAGTATTATPEGPGRAGASSGCAAGPAAGECAATSAVAAGDGLPFASASCEAAAGADCVRSRAASSAPVSASASRVHADAGCAMGPDGRCAAGVVADAGTGQASAFAVCEGASTCSYRATSHAAAPGAEADATGTGAGAGMAATSVSAAGGPGFASA